MGTRHSEAIILRTRDYGESDRLVTFFSRTHGKLTGIAKGARRSKKRFVHSLEPFSSVAITYVDKPVAGLVRIDACELRNAFTALRTDLLRLGYAALGCEVVLEMTPEREANPSIFTLLSQFLEQLEGGHDPENSTLLFQTRMLGISGYGPNLQTCRRCGATPPAFEQWFFSVPQGALLCPAHGHGRETYPLSLGTLLLLRQAQNLVVAKAWRLRFHPQSRRECRPLLLNLIRHHLEKDLKSLKLLYQIGALDPSGSPERTQA